VEYKTDIVTILLKDIPEKKKCSFYVKQQSFNHSHKQIAIPRDNSQNPSNIMSSLPLKIKNVHWDTLLNSVSTFFCIFETTRFIREERPGLRPPVFG